MQYLVDMLTAALKQTTALCSHPVPSMTSTCTAEQTESQEKRKDEREEREEGAGGALLILPYLSLFAEALFVFKVRVIKD